jgi:hypothetical protein
MRPAVVCLTRHPSATDTSSAKSNIALKWLGWIPRVNNQLLRPRAISYASNAPSMFTIPAAAMNRVP